MNYRKFKWPIILLVFTLTTIILACTAPPSASEELSSIQNSPGDWWGVELGVTVRLVDSVLIRCYNRGAVQDGKFLSSANSRDFGQDCSISAKLDIIETNTQGQTAMCFCSRDIRPVQYFPKRGRRIDLPTKGIIILAVSEELILANKGDIVRGVLQAKNYEMRRGMFDEPKRQSIYWEKFIVTGIEVTQ